MDIPEAESPQPVKAAHRVTVLLGWVLVVGILLACGALSWPARLDDPVEVTGTVVALVSEGRDEDGQILQSPAVTYDGGGRTRTFVAYGAPEVVGAQVALVYDDAAPERVQLADARSLRSLALPAGCFVAGVAVAGLGAFLAARRRGWRPFELAAVTVLATSAVVVFVLVPHAEARVTEQLEYRPPVGGSGADAPPLEPSSVTAFREDVEAQLQGPLYGPVARREHFGGGEGGTFTLDTAMADCPASFSTDETDAVFELRAALTDAARNPARPARLGEPPGQVVVLYATGPGVRVTTLDFLAALGDCGGALRGNSLVAPVEGADAGTFGPSDRTDGLGVALALRGDTALVVLNPGDDARWPAVAGADEVLRSLWTTAALRGMLR